MDSRSMLHSFNIWPWSCVLRQPSVYRGARHPARFEAPKTYGRVCYSSAPIHNRENEMENSIRKLLHVSRMPVRWGDMDAYGHVNNTVYFRYFEQTRVEWIEAFGGKVRPEEPVGPVIVNASCTFLRSVNYPSTVVIKMYGGEPGRSSVMTWYELFVEGEEGLFAEGGAKTVWIDMVTNKSVPLPDSVRALFD